MIRKFLIIAAAVVMSATALASVTTVGASVVAGASGAAGNDGEVTGKIVDSIHGKPIPGSCFTMWTSSGIFTFNANAQGDYDATNLPVGFWEGSAGICIGTPKYDNVVWNGNHGLDGNMDSVQFINVLGGGVPTTNINFALAKSGSIKVVLKDSATKKPISGATVCPDAAVADVGGHAFQSGFCQNTDAKGKVTLTGDVAESTKVFAFATGYSFSYYGGPDFASGTAFTVSAGKSTSIAMTLTHT